MGLEGGAGHRQALPDVQGPGLAVLQTAIVIKAVGHVAALLRLQNQGAALDGVEAAGVDLEEIALLDGDLPEQLRPPALVHHVRHFPGVGGIVADDNGGARVAVQHVPALGLAQGAVLMDPGVLVVGVDLNAQVVLGVDDLDEQGEGIPLYAAEELGARFP